MNMHRRRFVVATLVTGLLLAACGANEGSGPAGAAAEVAPGGTLHLLTDSSRIEWDPAKSSSLPITTLSLVHRRLTSWQVTPGGPAEIVPDLATDTGTPSDNGRTWTFRLKDGLAYSDGTPITAGDVKWGIERSYAPAFSGGLAYHKALLQGGVGYQGPFEGSELASIETPDDSTIVFRLARPYGDWSWVTSTPAFAPVPRGKGAEANYGDQPVASGPYQITSTQRGASTELDRNPHWTAESDPTRAAAPDRIVIELGQQASVISRRLIDDGGDDRAAFGIPFVSPAQLAQIQGNPGARERLVTSRTGALAYLAINTQRIPDPRVRQAFQYAVDKAAYQVATAGGPELAGDIATTLITQGIAGREQFDLYPTAPSGDPEQARRLLAEAGLPDGLSGLTLVVRNSQNFPEKAAAVQAALARANIQVEIRALESEAYDAEVTTATDPTYDLTLASWQPDFPTANANIQPLFASTEIGFGGYNSARYTNPEVDRLIEDAQATVDPAEAERKWAALDRRILQDSPVVPLIYTRNSFLAGSQVGNVTIGDFPAYPDYRQFGLRQ